MRLLTLLICSCILNTAYTQSFTAETGYIYTGSSNKEFYGSLDIKSGVIKKTDKLDIYAETGRKFQAAITKMEVDGNSVQSAKAGEYVTIYFTTTEDATTGNDYLRKGYKVFPKGFSTTVKKSNNITGYPDKFTATISGKAYRAASFNNAWYKKGIKGVAYDLPFLQLSIVNNDTTDTRSFVIQIFNVKEAPAIYNTDNSEVNFSGSETGKKEDSKVYGHIKGSKQNFTVQITKWQKSGNKVIISGKIQGELKETLSLLKKPEVLKLKDGAFENLEVAVYHEQGGFK